jgi:hypothetical protein
VERVRKAKEEKIRREVWERQNGIIPTDPIGDEPSLSPVKVTNSGNNGEGEEEQVERKQEGVGNGGEANGVVNAG